MLRWRRRTLRTGSHLETENMGVEDEVYVVYSERKETRGRERPEIGLRNIACLSAGAVVVLLPSRQT